MRQRHRGSRGLIAVGRPRGDGAVPLIAASDLRPEIVAGWNRYTAATEHRIAGSSARRTGFSCSIFSLAAPAARAAVAGGAVVIERMASVDAQGQSIEVPDALVHHWRGAVLLPGVTLDSVFAGAQERHGDQAGRRAAVRA